MEKSATSKQFILIVFVVAMATKMFMVPSMLLKTGGRDAYLSMAIFCAFDLIMLVGIMAAMKRTGDKSFFELCNDVLGSVVSKIFIGIIALYHLYKINLLINEIQEFFSVGLFEDFTWSLQLILLLILFLSAGKHRIRALSRLCEIMTPIIIISLILLLGLTVMSNYDFTNILPFATNGQKIYRSIVNHAIWFGDFTVLILFFGRTQLKKNTTKFAFVAAIISMCVVIFFSIVLCAAFGNIPELVNYGNNLANVTQYANGRIFGRIDLVIFTMWAGAVFVSAMMFFNSAVRSISYVASTKNYALVSFITIVAVYILQIAFIKNQSRIYSFSIMPAISIIGIVCQILIPVLAVFVSFVRRRHEKAKTES